MTESSVGHFGRKHLGDFDIVRELGRGGMGIVYEARQISLNRKVALKVLGTSLGMTSKAVIRFRREAEAAAKLHHTNIMLLLGEKEEAQQLSLDLLAPLRTSVMREQSMVLEVVAGRRSADAVLAGLEPSKRTQAQTRYVIAVYLLAQGRRVEARSHLQKSATIAGGTSSQEKWGKAFYERMLADPTWPPWIPMREDDGVKRMPEPATANGSGE